MKLRAAIASLTIGLGLSAALVAPAATAAHASTLSFLCDQNNECWVNEGTGFEIQTNGRGTGWAAEATGATWDNHAMYYIKTGSNPQTCASDFSGQYVRTATCGNTLPNDFFYLANSGAIVSEEASNQAGRWECLTVTSHAGGLIGNVPCPKTPTPAETFKFS